LLNYLKYFCKLLLLSFDGAYYVMGL